MNAAGTDPVKRALSSHTRQGTARNEGERNARQREMQTLNILRGIKGREETSGEDG